MITILELKQQIISLQAYNNKLIKGLDILWDIATQNMNQEQKDELEKQCKIKLKEIGIINT